MAVDAAGDPVVAGVSLTGRPTYKTECNFVAVKLARETGVVTWRTTFPDCESDETTTSSGGERVLLDPRGDVVVGRRSLAGRLYGVVKLAGSTGELIWRREPVGEFPKYGPFVHATVLDAAGAIVAGGGFGEYGSTAHTDLVVAKLDGGDGSELWRQNARGRFSGHWADEAFHRVAALAVAAGGDVFANGVLVSSPIRHRWTIARFDGATGALRWRHVAAESRLFGTGPRGPFSLALDARGDVVAVSGGDSSIPPRQYQVRVVKLSGATGAELWRRRLPRASYGGMLATVPSGDVVVAARLERRRGFSIVVVRLDGRSGRTKWRREILHAVGNYQDRHGAADPQALAVDSAGRVLVAGRVWKPGHGNDLLVFGLDGATGAERWQREIDGDAHANDEARALAVAGSDVVVVGAVENMATGMDAIAVAFSAASGEVRWRLECDGSDAGCRLGSPVR